MMFREINFIHPVKKEALKIAHQNRITAVVDGYYVEIPSAAQSRQRSNPLLMIGNPSDDDDFDDDPAFNGDWEFHEPQPGIAYSIVEEDDGNSWWRMEVPVTGDFGQNFDTWTGVDRAPQLRRAIEPDLDFLIETRVRIVPDPAPPSNSPFLAGLVLYYGGTDIIHWNIGQQRTINGQPTNLFLERSGINNIGHGWADGLLQGEAVRLRIEKRCDSYHFFYRGSADLSWTYAQTITTPTPLESIGLVMKTWGGGASFTADFDYFDIVEAGPRAAFTVDPEEGQEPLTVTVDASASTSPNGAITAYSWDFGDGTTAEGVTSEHTYQSRGTYTIRLDVTDEGGDQGQAANTVQAAFRSDDIAPWTLLDIGEPLPAIEGGARLEGEACLRVLAGGDGIRSRSDQFSFAYQQLPTTGPFIARLGEAAWAGRGRIGLMIREDLDPDSRFAAIVFADTGFRGLRYSFLRREEKAGIVRTTNSSENFEVGDAWVRLEYEAGEIIESARIALAAVAPTPLSADEASAWLAGKPATDENFAAAGDLASKIASPISDLRGPAEYRVHLTGVIVKRALNGATGRARGGDRNPVIPNGLKKC